MGGEQGRTNGNRHRCVHQRDTTVTFETQEIDIDLTMGNRNNVNRYPYKNARGEDSAIYLQPSEVAGVILTKDMPGSKKGVTSY